MPRYNLALTPLRTDQPQKNLYHLISRTKNSHPPRQGDGQKLKWVAPKDRIKWWNITPGDKVRLMVGKEEFTKKHKLEVVEVDRELNRVYLKDGPQLVHMVPNPTKDPETPKHVMRPMPVHYSNVQLYIGDFEFPPLPGRTEPRVMPVYATRVNRTPPTYAKNLGRYIWTRYAAQTTPRLPPKYDENGNKVRIEIPWPEYTPRQVPEPGPLDATAEEVLKVTWVPPPPTINPGAYRKHNPRPEDLYLKSQGADPSQPMEHFVAKELSSYWSRKNRTRRWQLRAEYRQKRLVRWIKREKRESETYADGRTKKEIILDATYKYERAEEERQKQKRHKRLMNTPRGQKIARKIKRTAKKKAKAPYKVNKVVLKPARNQYIPPGANVVEEVTWARSQSESTMRKKEKAQERKKQRN